MHMQRHDDTPLRRWNVFNVQAQQFVHPQGFLTEADAREWMIGYKTMAPEEWEYEVRIMGATYDPSQEPQL